MGPLKFKVHFKVRRKQRGGGQREEGRGRAERPPPLLGRTATSQSVAPVYDLSTLSGSRSASTWQPGMQEYGGCHGHTANTHTTICRLCHSNELGQHSLYPPSTTPLPHPTCPLHPFSVQRYQCKPHAVGPGSRG